MRVFTILTLTLVKRNVGSRYVSALAVSMSVSMFFYVFLVFWFLLRAVIDSYVGSEFASWPSAEPLTY